MALSRHPESSLVLSQFTFGNEAEAPTYPSPAEPADGFIHRRSLRARSPFTRPCRSFWSAKPSLFETRRRLTTSATAHDVRATKPELSFPRRDGGLDHLPFLTHHAAPLTEQWYAASRASSASLTPVLVLPGYPSLPNRDAFESAPPQPSLTPTEHSED